MIGCKPNKKSNFCLVLKIQNVFLIENVESILNPDKMVFICHYKCVFDLIRKCMGHTQNKSD